MASPRTSTMSQGSTPGVTTTTSPAGGQAGGQQVWGAALKRQLQPFRRGCCCHGWTCCSALRHATSCLARCCRGAPAVRNKPAPLCTPHHPCRPTWQQLCGVDGQRPPALQPLDLAGVVRQRRQAPLVRVGVGYGGADGAERDGQDDEAVAQVRLQAPAATAEGGGAA